MIHDYKNERYVRDEEPIGSAIAFLIYAALCLVLVTAPTWGPWIDGVCK